MTDHHDDFADHHYTGGEDDHHIPFEEPAAFDDVHHDLAWVDPAHYDDPHVVPEDHIPDISETHLDLPVDDPAEVFPPTIDVGPLPEPVDGFPWIDSGSLGLADIAAALHEADTTDPVQPHELAEYAATAALAKWWQQN